MSKIKVSDYIANFLVKNQITKCFTVTGGGAMHLNDSFGNHPKIECIYNHHEQACTMAAEGYTRISNKPGLVCVTSGPGSTNTITGVLGAWLDSIPMIVISGQMNYDTTIQSTPLPLRQLGFQECNIIDSIKPMTKYAEMITDPKYIAYHLEKALYLAENGRKGPVWLDIPLNIQSAIIDEEELIHYPKSTTKSSIPTIILDDVFNKIQKAEKPVILAGYGVRMSSSQERLLSLVEKSGIPVVTEWNSNDLIHNSHPYFAGRPGTIGDRGGNFVLQNADLVIAIGCQLSIRQISYNWGNFAKDAYKIGIDIDENELIKPTVNIDYPIHGDLDDFMKKLTYRYSYSKHNTDTNWYKWCKWINEKYPVVSPNYFNKGVNKPLSIYSFMKVLSDNTKNTDIITLANGAACVAGLQTIEVKKGQRVFTNAGASSMGYGLTSAIGASYSRNNNDTVICIEGDGSIQMNLQELQTVVHNNLNIKIFWINNDGYQSIKQTQTNLFNAKEKGYYGADKDSGISFPSAENIAKAYGIKFVKVDEISYIGDKIKETLNTLGPVICEVVTFPNEPFRPKLQSKLLENGEWHTPSLEDMSPFLSDDEMKENKFDSERNYG